MNNPYSLLSLASLLVALLAFIATQLTTRRTHDKDYVTNLRDRNEDLAAQLEDCRRHKAQLLDENIELLRRIALNKPCPYIRKDGSQDGA